MNFSLLSTPLSERAWNLVSWKKSCVPICLALSVKEPVSPSPQRGYDDLQTIVPTCQQQDFAIGSPKLSKAIVLQKSMARRALEGLELRGL